MKLSRLLVTLSGALMFSFASANSADTLKPFPLAEEGSVRYVIELPKLSDESAVKVQLIAGKTIEVDCNRQSFGGNFAEETVEGWGYNYYNISELTGPMTTLMACGDDTKHEASVTNVSTKIYQMKHLWKCKILRLCVITANYLS